MQMGVNLFASFGISAYFPFKYFDYNTIKSPKPGILFSENFDHQDLFKTWSDLWMREEGTVTHQLTADGFNGSRCLLIKNSSTGSWSYSHKKLVEVKKGDRYYFEGFAKVRGQELSAAFSVAAFDSEKKVIDWNRVKQKVDKYGAWIKVATDFDVVDDAIKFIQFRLVGKGIGEYRFDQIEFHKIK
jgi:hypothetical protein